MRIERARVRPFQLPLRSPLRTARGTIRERRGALLVLECEDGLCSVGEAAPLHGFGGEALTECLAWLHELAAALPGRTLEDPGPQPPADAPVARGALATALADARARQSGLPLSGWLAGRPTAEAVRVNALIAGDTTEGLVEAALDAQREGFGTLKIKVGGRPPAADVERLRAVRAAVGADVRLRADANGAWNEREARMALDALAPVGLELVEEPLAERDVEALARLRRASPVPIAADESLRSAADAHALLARDAVDALVLKPAWLGGIGEAWRIARTARRHGVSVIVTSALDAAVGRAAALHLAAAIDGPWAAGLATGGLLARDVAVLDPPRDGRMRLPPGPGLGVAA